MSIWTAWIPAYGLEALVTVAGRRNNAHAYDVGSFGDRSQPLFRSILNRQLDRRQTLNEQCRGGASYNCKKKGEQNHKTCEDREFNSIKAACWQRLALDKILISKGCEYQTKKRPLGHWICK